MNYIGLDLSFTGTGVMVLNEDSSIRFQNLLSTPAKLDTEYRIIDQIDRIIETIEDYGKPIICIEGLSFGSKGQSTLDLAGLHFCLRVALYKDDHHFFIIPPTTLKKFVTGTGRCQKNLMLLKCYRKFGMEFDNDNLCDAYCLAKYGLEKNKELKNG